MGRIPDLDFDSALVTGGAGFIGSHLCEALVAQGKRVVCLDNFVAGKSENVEHLEASAEFELVKADVSELDEIAEHFRDVDVVFHNAASKNTVCREDPHLDLRVNAWGAWCVAEAARLNGVRKVVHASTGSVYGELLRSPQDEDHPLGPRSFYGTSKLAGESYLRAFADYYPGFRYSVIRYFHVYGPRQESGDWGGVVPIFIRRAFNDQPLQIYGDGTQVRSFTFVEDDVAANIVLANSERADGEAFNAASGIRITVRELADKILRVMGKPELPIEYGPWRPGDIRNFDVDNSRIREAGAEFTTGFDEGLRRTVDWYVSQFRSGA